MRLKLLLPALLFPVYLAAQMSTTADTMPFHRGQWGAQFIGLTSSFGVIKFTSPTRAWTLDLRINGTHSESIVNDTVQGVNSSASLDVITSRRTYRPIARNVVAHHSLGLLFGFDHNVATLLRASSNGFAIGPFVDVGATYLVVSHIGVGVRGSAGVSYGYTWLNTPPRNGHSWLIHGSTGFDFLTTIYF